MRNKIYIVFMETEEGKEIYSVNSTRKGAEDELIKAEMNHQNFYSYIEDYFVGE